MPPRIIGHEAWRWNWPLVRVNALAPGTVLEGSTMFPRSSDRLADQFTSWAGYLDQY